MGAPPLALPASPSLADHPLSEYRPLREKFRLCMRDPTPRQARAFFCKGHRWLIAIQEATACLRRQRPLLSPHSPVWVHSASYGVRVFCRFGQVVVCSSPQGSPCLDPSWAIKGIIVVLSSATIPTLAARSGSTARAGRALCSSWNWELVCLFGFCFGPKV